MKNRIMRVAALLLTLTLMTSCFVGGTFAKYTTAGTTTDTARVAKWGVTVVADGSHTFGGSYLAVGGGNTLTATYNANTDTVKSEGGKVVAPGTKGTAAGLTINGQPEVDTKVTFDATVTLNGWQDTTGYYCPLVITVTTDNKGTVVKTPIYGMVYDSADKFAAAVAAEVEKATEYFEAGTAIDDGALTIEWEWPFEGGFKQDNGRDTNLGDAAIPATITIAVTAIVEQID